MLRPDESGILRVSGWTDWDWLIHGFSTRPTGDFLAWPSDGEICARFGADSAETAMLKQVHSGRCVRADRAWSGDRPEADAVCTNRPNVLVGVRTADCLPILLVDPRRRAVAAVHAGWRGASTRVLPSAIESMESEYGCRPCDVEAAIGPGIGPCCFEVGEEVAGQFSEEFVDRDGPKPHVDLAGILGAQLRQSGVERCATAGDCTSCDLARYFSHRAEHGDTGRMLALVGLREG
ncbi:MAG: peptidoglycan editing factor PgeF [Acidobacteriia bacterium]|nr:peptidoglycan editing factor PgeF [Terriglobia bacterium]